MYLEFGILIDVTVIADSYLSSPVIPKVNGYLRGHLFLGTEVLNIAKLVRTSGIILTKIWRTP